MNSVGYVRVSTLDQAKEGVSLSAQEERIRAYCKMSRLHLVRVVKEEGVSAAIPLSERPGGRKLLESVSDGVAHVIALKLDRLFRDAGDCLNQTREWDKAGVSLHLLDLGGQAINTGSAMGRMFLTITAAFAELERNLISERTVMALAHKQATGQHIGRTPFGFTIREKRLYIVPEEWAVVAEVRRRRESGLTLREIASWLNGKGVPTQRGGQWSISTIRNLVSDKRYAEAREPI